MRVQSETLRLERGAPTERYQKHESRHSAVWCEEIEDKSTVLFVKLSRRKSRSRGSLLRRTCTCHLGDTRCCVAHVAQRVLNLVAAGEKLFQFNGTEFRRVLRRLLTFLVSELVVPHPLQPVGTPLERYSSLVNGNRRFS